YIDHGDPTFECSSCGALLWYAESMRRANNTCSDSYSLCCGRGGKQDTSVNVGRGPYCYRLRGENYHLAGPLLPADGKPTKFAQLYVFDTENEIQNRIGAVSNGESSSSRNNELDYQLTTNIHDLLDEINPRRDGRQYNLPTESEVAALIVRDFDSTKHMRDIILYCQDGDFKRISELHQSYLALHYPLFFLYNEDNYRSDIFHEGVTGYDEKTKEHALQ
ncbi:hypothetical protein Tco_1529046, partial [Tanacetum coccineum]